MKIELIIEPHDSLELHNMYEKLYKESSGGMYPIRLPDEFWFMPEVEIRQDPLNKYSKHSGRISIFKLTKVYS